MIMNTTSVERKLDAQVAEHVLGCTVRSDRRVELDGTQHDARDLPYCGCASGQHNEFVGTQDGPAALFRYSADMRAAWTVVETLGGRFHMFRMTAGGYACEFDPHGHFRSVAHEETAPLAICRAALLAVA